MPLPSSGPISFSDIQSQFGGTNPISLSEYYRGGGFVTNTGVNNTIPTSGAISVNNFYNTYGRVPIAITISASTNNYDAYASRTLNYVAGVSDLTYTINAGVVIGSANTSLNAFLISASFLSTDTVTVINNGRITGAGGNGGRGSDQRPGGTGAAGGGGGGTALSVARAVTITNNGTVAGGGGGGGGGGGSYFGRNAKSDDNIAGGGGGGGAGAVAGSGASGGTAAGQENNYNGNAGGAGTLTAGGGGGATNGGGYGAPTGYGGAGGGPGVAGTNGVNGQVGSSGGAGGAAGFYAVGNSNITWAVTGTRLGQVS
jgi:hypothetical protein